MNKKESKNNPKLFTVRNPTVQKNSRALQKFPQPAASSGFFTPKFVCINLIDTTRLDPVEIDSKIYMLAGKAAAKPLKNYKVLLNQTSGALYAVVGNDKNERGKVINASKGRATSNKRYDEHPFILPLKKLDAKVPKAQISTTKRKKSPILSSGVDALQEEVRPETEKNVRKAQRSVSPQMNSENATTKSPLAFFGNYRLPSRASKNGNELIKNQSNEINDKTSQNVQPCPPVKINLSGILKRIIKMDVANKGETPGNERPPLRSSHESDTKRSHRRAASDHKHLAKDEISHLIRKPRDKTSSIERPPGNVINVSIHQNIKNIFSGRVQEGKRSGSVEKGRDASFAKTPTKNLTLSQDREKLISYNRLYTKSHKEVPPTTLDYYKFVRLIGKGAFGKVTLGIHKLTGKHVAIKTIDKKYMKDEFSRKKVFQEVYILKKIRHANIIRLLEVFEGPQHILMVMEYAAGGDMLRYVKEKGPLDESEARAIFKQIVYGLAHIHSRTVLHRDIKLDNILFDTEQGVKICDFGVSRIVKKGEVIKEQCGTPAYIAPEIISDEGYEGFYADHWSLGILLYAMLCAAVPFKAQNLKELLEVIKNTEITFPVKISRPAKHLIRSLLQIDPYERLTLPAVLSHPWMQDKSEQSLLEDSSDVYLGYKECHNPEADANPSNISIVNVGNIFSNEKGANEKLSYNDYCMISNDLYTQHIEEDVLKTLERYGYPRELVLKGLQGGELNHATATYNLLVLP